MCTCSQPETYTYKKNKHMYRCRISQIYVHCIHTHTQTEREIQYTVCVWMSPGPGVPLRGNCSARRGSVSAASCFLSLSLCDHWLYPWRAWLAHYYTQHVCMCMCVCVRESCIPACMFASSSHLQVLFLPCFTHDWLTAVCQSVYWCVSVYLSVCLHCVTLCVSSLWLVWLLTC